MQPLLTELKKFKKSKIDIIFSNPWFTYTHSRINKFSVEFQPQGTLWCDTTYISYDSKTEKLPFTYIFIFTLIDLS